MLQIGYFSIQVFFYGFSVFFSGKFSQNNYSLGGAGKYSKTLLLHHPFTINIFLLTLNHAHCFLSTLGVAFAFIPSRKFGNRGVAPPSVTAAECLLLDVGETLMKTPCLCLFCCIFRYFVVVFLFFVHVIVIINERLQLGK